MCFRREKMTNAFFIQTRFGIRKDEARQKLIEFPIGVLVDKDVLAWLGWWTPTDRRKLAEEGHIQIIPDQPGLNLDEFKKKFCPEKTEPKKKTAEKPKQGEGIEIQSLEVLLSKGVPEFKWLIQNIVPKRGITILGGDSGSHKTWFAMTLALSCATGNLLFGVFEVMKGKVLYIDEENGIITLLNRFYKLKKGLQIVQPLNNIELSIFNNVKLDAPGTSKVLESIIQKHKPSLVIIDSMVRCMFGEEDKARDVKLIFDTLKGVMEKFEIAFLILHHTVKGNSRNKKGLRGSGDFSAFADMVFMFDAGKTMTSVICEKARFLAKEDAPNFAIQLKEEYQGLVLEHLPTNPEKDTLKAQVYDEIIEFLEAENREVFRTKEFCSLLEIKKHDRNLFYDVLPELKKNRILRNKCRGKFVYLNYEKIDEIEV